ncbi:hypothetical protein N0K08_01775 [Acidovorax sp. Be4]|jgi:hypothetical protein|uniref:Uncharacterized protein n=1 Tax=Acidovorax bellezanensis TaxID=2976702 RepID=A0ABT2PG43_9BURK|nr:hypothetical protein [Acidovorax sp. Be4]MCT9809353.1 hypothetical protein [Acidovorax sp. Be4]
MSTLTALGFVGWALLLAPVADGAQPARSASTTTQASPAPEKRALSRRKPKIQHAPSPSQESPAQRDRRLARECQGLPNAGACLGHALPRP